MAHQGVGHRLLAATQLLHNSAHEVVHSRKFVGVQKQPLKRELRERVGQNSNHLVGSKREKGEGGEGTDFVRDRAPDGEE